MNFNEVKMLELLKSLKNDYGVIGIKAEFEAEGTRLNEMISLNEIIARADSKLFLKIGGCEAVSDIDMSKVFGAQGIIAPMIETEFALKKFISSFKKTYADSNIEGTHLFINMETKTGYENLDAILSCEEMKYLSGVVIGRVDFSGSYGMSRKDIESEFIFEKCKKTLEKVKNIGLIAGMGGAISSDTFPIIERLQGLIDRVETRKVIFDVSQGIKNIQNGLKKAIEFEYYYIKNLCETYHIMSIENAQRVEMLEKRIKAFEA